MMAGDSKTKKTMLIMIPLVMIVAIVMVASCGPQEAKKPPDEVTVQLKWVHQSQFAGVYAADQKGFYTEENINATIKPGGPEIPWTKMVDDLLNGETTFAIIGGGQLLTARSQGKSIIGIAVVFQKNPYVYVTLKNSGIKRPQDLVGKRIMVPTDGEIHHTALLQNLDIDPDTIEYITYERDIAPLTTGQIDAHMLYRTGFALTLEEQGYELDFIWVEDYGVKFYADTIVATEMLVQQNPELVVSFLRATMDGWRYAIENPTEALDVTMQYDPTMDRSVQERMMQVTIPLIHTGAPIGWMDPSVWQLMHQVLLDGGVLKQAIDIDEAFTMQFLNKIYGKGE